MLLLVRASVSVNAHFSVMVSVSIIVSIGVSDIVRASASLGLSVRIIADVGDHLWQLSLRCALEAREIVGHHCHVHIAVPRHPA